MTIGRPPLEITDEMIKKAENLASRGLTVIQIARCLGMGERTLYTKQNMYKHFRQAIKNGRSKGIGTIANCLFEGAKSGNVPSQIFYLKTRAGWIEKLHVVSKDSVNKEKIRKVKKTILAIKEKEKRAKNGNPA